jgi:hypothetical protein
MHQILAKSAPFALLFAAGAYLFSRTLEFDFPRAPGRLGPDTWPQAILVLLMITCGVGILREILTRQAEGGGGGLLPTGAGADEQDVPSRYGLVAAGLLLFLAYPTALEYLGFIAATFVLMLLFMRVGQWRSVPGIVAVSAIGTLALFYIFRGVVYVSLPLGRGPFHDWTVWVAGLLGMR